MLYLKYIKIIFLNYITGVEKLQSSIPTDRYYPLEFCGNLSTGIPPFRKKMKWDLEKHFFKENTLNEHSSALFISIISHIGKQKHIAKKNN